MKKNYMDPEVNVTRFEYEDIMEVSIIPGEIPDIGDIADPGDFD